jgi:hypothetical protein
MSKIGFGSKIKTHKTYYQCLKTLNYLLIMICELTNTRIKIKRDLKLAPTIMFIGWIWRTKTQICLENPIYTAKPKRHFLDL